MGAARAARIDGAIEAAAAAPTASAAATAMLMDNGSAVPKVTAKASRNNKLVN